MSILSDLLGIFDIKASGDNRADWARLKQETGKTIEAIKARYPDYQELFAQIDDHPGSAANSGQSGFGGIKESSSSGLNPGEQADDPLAKLLPGPYKFPDEEAIKAMENKFRSDPEAFEAYKVDMGKKMLKLFSAMPQAENTASALAGASSIAPNSGSGPPVQKSELEKTAQALSGGGALGEVPGEASADLGAKESARVKQGLFDLLERSTKEPGGFTRLLFTPLNELAEQHPEVKAFFGHFTAQTGQEKQRRELLAKPAEAGAGSAGTGSAGTGSAGIFAPSFGSSISSSEPALENLPPIDPQTAERFMHSLKYHTFSPEELRTGGEQARSLQVGAAAGDGEKHATYNDQRSLSIEIPELQSGQEQSKQGRRDLINLVAPGQYAPVAF